VKKRKRLIRDPGERRKGWERGERPLSICLTERAWGEVEGFWVKSGG